MRITGAKYLKQYQLMVFFESEQERMVDFENFLRENKNPMNRQFLNVEKFRTFTIDTVCGVISWNGPEGEMDFNAEHLPISPELSGIS